MNIFGLRLSYSWNWAGVVSIYAGANKSPVLDMYEVKANKINSFYIYMWHIWFRILWPVGVTKSIGTLFPVGNMS